MLKSALFTLFLFAASGAQVQCLDKTDCSTGLPQIGVSQGATQADLQIILGIFFGILAVVSVIIIVVWGGLRFITDSDNPQETAKARSTIIYALVGLGIAVSGEAIVAFLLNRVG